VQGQVEMPHLISNATDPPPYITGFHTSHPTSPFIPNPFRSSPFRPRTQCLFLTQAISYSLLRPFLIPSTHAPDVEGEGGLGCGPGVGEGGEP
jgi:hypothetical protein